MGEAGDEEEYRYREEEDSGVWRGREWSLERNQDDQTSQLGRDLCKLGVLYRGMHRIGCP
jgi:hypothetical protein